MSIERIVLVTKPTPLEELLRRHNSRAQAAFFLRTRGDDISEYDAGHLAYRCGLERIRSGLPREIPLAMVERDQLGSFLFRAADLVIVTGPDGLFVNLAKYIGEQPVLAINPDPERIDGIVMRHPPAATAAKVRAILNGSFETTQITLARAATNDGRELHAVNDFLIGRCDQISARYVIAWRSKRERQSSSGILVSTGLGVSGWMKSVVAMVGGLGGGEALRKELPQWADRSLVFVVREPFPSGYTNATIVHGRITARTPLVVTSEMPEGGAIFSDGMPDDRIEFGAGCTATIHVADRTANLVV